MQVRGRVGEGGERFEGEGAGVEGDGGGVGIHDEAVVEVGGGGGEGEGFVGGDVGVGGDVAMGNAGGVEGEVLVCAEDDDCAFDCGGAGVEVEVAVKGRQVSLVKASYQLLVLSWSEGVVPVVRNPHDRLVAFVPYEFDFPFCFQYRLSILHTRRVPDPALHRPRISLLSVLAQVLERNPLLTIPAYGFGPLKVFLTPTLLAAVQTVRPIVHRQSIRLAIEILDLAILDTVRRASDGFAEVRRIVSLVEFGFGEALHDVDARNFKLLDQSALREEGEGGFACVTACGGCACGL